MSKLLGSLAFSILAIISIVTFTLLFGVQKVSALASFPGFIVVFFIIFSLKML